MCYNIVSTLCFRFLALRHMGSYLSDQGIKPAPLALEGEVLTTEPPGKSLTIHIFLKMYGYKHLKSRKNTIMLFIYVFQFFHLLQ